MGICVWLLDIFNTELIKILWNVSNWIMSYTVWHLYKTYIIILYYYLFEKKIEKYILFRDISLRLWY
jgi:hypothetical protein